MGKGSKMCHPIVERSCRYQRNLAARLRMARYLAFDFAVKCGFIKWEKFNSGSSLPDDSVRVTYCFGRYFDKWDKPETKTVDLAKTYIWNIGNKG